MADQCLHSINSFSVSHCPSTNSCPELIKKIFDSLEYHAQQLTRGGGNFFQGNHCSEIAWASVCWWEVVSDYPLHHLGFFWLGVF